MEANKSEKTPESTTTSREVLHLMTQDRQPYGSSRRCCEVCGIMIWPHPQPTWTDDRRLYANPPDEYVPCNKVEKELL